MVACKLHKCENPECRCFMKEVAKHSKFKFSLVNQPYFNRGALAPPTNCSTRMRIQGKIRLVYKTSSSSALLPGE